MIGHEEFPNIGGIKSFKELNYLPGYTKTLTNLLWLLEHEVDFTHCWISAKIICSSNCATDDGLRTNMDHRSKTHAKKDTMQHFSAVTQHLIWWMQRPRSCSIANLLACWSLEFDYNDTFCKLWRCQPESSFETHLSLDWSYLGSEVSWEEWLISFLSVLRICSILLCTHPIKPSSI